MGNNQIEILVVEDNPDDVKLVTLAFKNYHILELSKIHVARDGAEALEYLFGSVDRDDLLLSHHPRLIFLDLTLPQVNGLEVLKRIKSHPEARKIPVIILTGSDKEEDWMDAYSLGANKYIRKPGDFDQFVEAAGWALLDVVGQVGSIEYQ